MTLETGKGLRRSERVFGIQVVHKEISLSFGSRTEYCSSHSKQQSANARERKRILTYTVLCEEKGKDDVARTVFAGLYTRRTVQSKNSDKLRCGCQQDTGA